MQVSTQQFLFDVRDFVKHPLIINFFEQAFLLRSIFLSLFKVITFMQFQWSSSHEERAKVIQEGLMNPSADILEAMVETETARAGKVPYPFKNVPKHWFF